MEMKKLEEKRRAKQEGGLESSQEYETMVTNMVSEMRWKGSLGDILIEVYFKFSPTNAEANWKFSTYRLVLMPRIKYHDNSGS